MSKVSVFKFDISKSELNVSDINEIVHNYLNTRGFFYNDEKYCYIAGTPTKKDEVTNAALSVGMSVASAVLTGGKGSSIIFNSIQNGFEYYIVNDQLVIKAYLINKNSKSFIHSTFNNSQDGAYYYGDLKGSLFKELKKNNINLVSKKIEKIKDGSEKKILIIIGIFALIMICISVIAFLFLLD